MPPLHFALPCLLFAASFASRASAQELELEARLGAPARPAEELQLLRATLRNRGDRPLEILLPEHLGLVPFPAWELRDESGRTVRPETPPFQSEWKLGLQGEVLKLAPGAEQSFDVETVVPPGRWRARCVLAQERAEVPWGKPGFREELRPWPTLWTGRVESASFTFEVAAYRAPRLELALPERVTLGGTCLATGSLLWPSAAGPRPARLALRVNLGSKARGSATAFFAWDGARWSPSPELHHGALPALDGERLPLALDLATALYERERGSAAKKSLERLELGELLDDGWFYASVSGVDQHGAVRFHGELTSSLEQAPSAAPSGLAIAVRASARGPRYLEFVLRNTSSTPRRIPADLGVPNHLGFALRFAEDPSATHWSVISDAEASHVRGTHVDPPSLAVLPRSLSWSSRAFERSSAAPTEVLLAPGSELTRTLDLRAFVHDPQRELDRALLVQAIWSNRRVGLESAAEPPLTIGVLVGAELSLPAIAR
ncbi:MAG: hypothetical protein IPN34_02710 [Planctomycetes bacterium]|nr:hypothetical protein [Planctomycetota bacterium]